ncbi:MAG: sigma-70 family RNA polymerase sigma factor [Phycisphaerales bacterium]
MFEDKWLIWKLRQGSSDALCHIYEKYKKNMLALAHALLNDKTLAEDIVHDCFVSFAGRGKTLELKTCLKSYLLVSVANRIKNLSRDNLKSDVDIDEIEIADLNSAIPLSNAINIELAGKIDSAMQQLPYDQREIISLHLQHGLKFREIASLQNVSINTIQSRYRYGIDKLRTLLDEKV